MYVALCFLQGLTETQSDQKSIDINSLPDELILLILSHLSNTERAPSELANFLENILTKIATLVTRQN